MAKTDDIVTLSEGKGKNKIVYHYTEASIKKFVKNELIEAIEAGEKSAFMRLLHLRRGNLDFVKKDCAESIFDKIEDFKKNVGKDQSIAVEYLAGGYIDTIKKIIDETIDGLAKNVNFAKKMIKENPIQVIELGMFKDFINEDGKMLVLLFNSLLENDDPNAGKLADKLYNKYISKDIEKLMMIAKNPKAEKYVISVLEGDAITSKTQYAKFARTAAKYNPAVLNSIDPERLAPADILAIVKMNVMSTPSVVNLLTYLDDKTAKKYLKITIKFSNQKMREKLAEIKASGSNEKLAEFKEEAKVYLTEFRDSATVVANYIEDCEIYDLYQKTEQLNIEAGERHAARSQKIIEEFNLEKSSADQELDVQRTEKSVKAVESITDEDYAYMFMEVSRDMGINSFDKDESETFMQVVKARLADIDEKFPKDTYPENNKKLKNETIKATFKDLLAGKVKTKITQKLYNASLPRREKLAKKLTSERIDVLIEERYSELIKEFEIKYNDLLNKLIAERDLKIGKSKKTEEKDIAKNEAKREKKIQKLDKNKADLIATIESEDDLGL